MGRCLKILMIAWLAGMAFMPVAQAQHDSLKAMGPVTVVPGHYAHFSIDRLGNYYLLSEAFSQIKKLDSHRDSIGRYDNVRQYGSISLLDVSNPLKLTVYYKDFATVVILDRFLNPVNTIDLRKAGINAVGAVATSYDNQLWVYDQQAAKIKKIDGQGKVTFSSSDLRSVFDSPVNPISLMDRDGLLYLYDPNSGWYIFDYYGGFKKQVLQLHLEDVAADNGHLTGRTGNRLWVYTPGKVVPQEQTVAVGNTSEGIRQLQVFNRRVYILDTSGIHQYNVQP